MKTSLFRLTIQSKYVSCDIYRFPRGQVAAGPDQLTNSDPPAQSCAAFAAASLNRANMHSQEKMVPLDLTIPEGSPVRLVIDFFRRQPQPAYLVGGWVRDFLLKRPTKDMDVTVPSDAIPLARRLADESGGAFVLLDEARDTGRAILPGSGGETFEVDCSAWRGDTLAEDLRARDFSINALAIRIGSEEPELIDVTGGVLDLENGTLRAISRQSLLDDPLRGLRAVRLAAELADWGFRLERDTAAWVAQDAPRLAHCSSERVRDELVRILAVHDPEPWLRLMAELGQMAVLLPEVDSLRGIAQSPPHYWDVFEHTMRTVGNVAWLGQWILVEGAARYWPHDQLEEALGRHRPHLFQHFTEGESAVRTRLTMLPWAALCHDWGKPGTRDVAAEAGEDARVRFYGHEAVGARMASDALLRLRFNAAEARRISAIVAGHMRPLLLAIDIRPPSRRAIYRYFQALGSAGVDVAILSLADLQAVYGPQLEEAQWYRLLFVVERLLDEYFHHRQQSIAPPPLVDGYDLMAEFDLYPGRLVGRLLEEVAEAQAAGEIQTRQQAVAYAARFLGLDGQPAPD